MKKIICYLFLITLFFSLLTHVQSTYALTTLYQKETESKISSGTILKNYNLLTDAGWLNINILEIDLEDKYTQLGLLTNHEGTGKLKNVLSMAQESAAIAAVNGDFFAGNAGKGHSIGLAINDSEIISSAASDNFSKNTFSSFLLNEDNEVFFEYLTNKITLTSKKTKESIEVAAINKYLDNYATPALYTRAWGEYSLGSSDGLVLTEMVVKNNKVTEIRYNEPAVEIPENGFVISTLGAGSDFINENFKKGTKVELDYSLIPDIEDIEFAISNGSKLLKEGKIPNAEDIEFAISGGAKLLDEGEIPETFSHNITGRNPRTALGVDEDAENLYLITVDGRQTSSIGMTQTELAEFLKDIGIYNAINLDGGGSTTMVAQKSGSFSLSTINNPSGGSLRSVINAVGIFSTAPNSKKLYGLNIEIEDTNIFKGEEREIKITGYNKYYNPVEVDFDEVEFDYNGVNLIISDGKISGNTVGTSYLTASVGKIKTEIEINILSDANELFISPKNTGITPGEKVNYTIQAKNKNGYYATTPLNTISAKIVEFYSDGIKQNYIPEDAKLQSNTPSLSYNATYTTASISSAAATPSTANTANTTTTTFTAKTPGDYVIAFSKGSITSYAIVNVSSPKAIVLDDFETESFTFDEYPDEVIGNATLSKEQVYSGKTSAKLEYDFNQDIQIRGAYIELNNPLTIPKDATALSFWVYNDSYKDEKLKIKIKDANASTKLIVLENALSHEGWKEIKYDLSNIALPATISDIYLAQDNLSIKNSGYIFVDKLAYYSNNAGQSTIRMPKDIKLEDQNNKNFQSNNSYNIALIDNLEEPILMIDNLKYSKLIKSINNHADLAIITNKLEVPIASSNNNSLNNNSFNNKWFNENWFNEIECEKIISKGYELIERENATFITLDISNKSIRTTDAAQWTNLQYDIKKSQKDNIFIILNDSIDNFTDLAERKVFIDTLCELKRETKKNITVLHNGFFTDYTMERGVKFLSVNTENIAPEKIATEFSYILISVVGDNVSYEIKTVF